MSRWPDALRLKTYEVLLLRHRLRRQSYARFYGELMDRRASADPRRAVGGRWDEIGPLQLRFLVQQGLQRDHAFLDYGCGSLRGGRHVIAYLDPGRYTGVDVSPVMLEAASRLVAQEQLTGKRPQLSHTDGSLSELNGRRFDVVLAHSVLVHMPAPAVRSFIRQSVRLTAPGGVTYATCYLGPEWRNIAGTNFRHPFELFGDVADELGLDLHQFEPDEYPHPRGQRMLRWRASADR